MPIYRLDPDEIWFPDPAQAEPSGLLAVEGDLSPARLLTAYRYGIFPWYSEGEPILWWSLHPRFVLFPADLKVSKSMRPYFNQQKFTATYNQAFTRVMQHCQQAPRTGQQGTWITTEMIDAYTHLHELGYAHSVEVWDDTELVGGLYGIGMGQVFYGESMFARASNASKFGFISLVRVLQAQGVQLIDCQQQTPHLGSLGARTIPRQDFMRLLDRYADPEVRLLLS